MREARRVDDLRALSMCGIALAVQAGASATALWTTLVEEVACRGPDAQQTCTQDGISLYASVLGLRGETVTMQPLTSPDNTLWLAWNGQVFEADEESWYASAENDAVILLRHIQAVAPPQRKEALCSLLAGMDGPYAFALVDFHERAIYFGRDPLGRRSLLYAQHEGSTYVCSVASDASVQQRLPWAEVDCTSIWRLGMETRSDPTTLSRNLRTHSTTRLTLCAPSSPIPTSILPAFAEILEESVRRRVQCTRVSSLATPGAARIAVLFSGGLDCTVLACLAARHVPHDEPIDLINVAFENPRAIAAAWAVIPPGATIDEDQFPADPYAVPDRMTAQKSLDDLQRLYPSRTWQLVRVNVPFAEYTAHAQHIETLMYPAASVMDLSIAAALYFASRGRGDVHGHMYTSPARILLSGLGADELLAGYARHRQAWRRGGDVALTAELQMDMDRLPTRNLGRDDRVFSSHAREARYPYLARSVMAYLATLPVRAKADFSEDGHGDKQLLRALAAQLGLAHASTLPKRAIQFGARSAKMDARGARQKGHAALHTPSS